MKTIISLSTLVIITVFFSFTSKQQNYSAKYQNPLNDSIKVKLTQKLQSISNHTDKQKITELINLNDTISGIKPDYSNTNVSKLKSYKKKLAENIPDYKRLGVMDAFKFNYKKVAKSIRDLEMIVINQRVEKAKQELVLTKYNAQKQTNFTQASLAYQRLLKKENITQEDVDNYKTNYPEYSRHQATGKQKTWLELLQQLVQ